MESFVRHRTVPRRLQRGFSLIEAALMVLLIGAALAAGTLVLKAKQPARVAQSQEESLQWADQALVAFAAAHARLPCPVSSPTGAEPGDCVAAGQKGWLPVQTLETVVPRLDGAGPGRAPPLRYMVYHGNAASDLTVATNRFNPHKWDGTTRDYDAINGLDFCAALVAATVETSTARADRANVDDIRGVRHNVAYALAVPGPTSGNGGGRFDDRNQDTSIAMESPARADGSDYDDRVRARDFASLAQAMGCADARNPADAAATPDSVLLASLDTVALGVDVADEVTEQHDGNKRDTDTAVIFASLSEVFATLNIALAGANISNSSTTLATASAQLSAAIAACALPPWAQCALIPVYTAAVTAGSVAVGLSTTATVLAGAALVPTTAGLALTVQASDMAKQPLGSSNADLADVVQTTCTAAEGGLVSKGLDGNGALIDLIPAQWRDGLKQDVERAEQDLAKAQADEQAARARLTYLESGPPSPLLLFNPMPDPGESKDDDDAAEQDAWANEKRQWELDLRAKLEAIRASQDARFDYEKALKAAEDAKREWDTVAESVARLTIEVALCDTNPPAPATAQFQRCEVNRRGLKTLRDCEFQDATQAQQRQCVRLKQEDYNTAVAARDAAYTQYQQRLAIALNKPQPPLKDYIGWSGCWIFGCNVLISPFDFDDDERETYAKTYYMHKGMTEAVALKQQELDDKRVAYDSAQVQCDQLRLLSSAQESEGATLQLVIGAEEILKKANYNGAVGAVYGTNPGQPAPQP